MGTFFLCFLLPKAICVDCGYCFIEPCSPTIRHEPLANNNHMLFLIDWKIYSNILLPFFQYYILFSNLYDGIEPFAVLSYSVFHTRRIAVAFSSFYQMIVSHLSEPFCQHLLADAVNVCLNGLEARTAI